MIIDNINNSIHSPPRILTVEVQRQIPSISPHFEGHESGNGNNDDDGINLDNTRCGNTFTTIATESSKSYTLSSDLSSISEDADTSAPQDEICSQQMVDEHFTEIAQAQNKIRNIIDNRSTTISSSLKMGHTTTTAEKSAFDLIRMRQQLREQQQYTSPCVNNKLTREYNHHQKDECAHTSNRIQSSAKSPSPIAISEQGSTKKIIILSHHIDKDDLSSKHQHDSIDIPSSKVNSTRQNDKVVIASNLLATTSNKSRSSSPGDSGQNENVFPQPQQFSNVSLQGQVDRDVVIDQISDNNETAVGTQSHNEQFVVANDNSEFKSLEDRTDTLGSVNDQYHTPNLSVDKELMSTINPIMIEKVANSITLNATNSKVEPQTSNDVSLATSRSTLLDIDSDMMKHVTSSVRDYIDSLTEKSNVKSELVENCQGDNIVVEDAILVKDNVSRPLKVDVTTNVQQVDDLVEYLSTRSLAKNVKNRTCKDPPLFEAESRNSSDDMEKADPPLNPTLSEMTRSAVIEPETNPLKIYTLDDGEYPVDNSHISMEPYTSNPTILYDEFGERSNKSKSSIGTDHGGPVDTKTLSVSCDSDNTRTLYPHSEKIVITPKRKTTVLTVPTASIPEEIHEIHTKDTFEPDGIYPADDVRDFALAVRNLHYLLSGDNDTTDFDIQMFGQLVRFSSKFLNSSSNMTSYGISQILTHANELNVSLVITDRYLDAIRSMNNELTRNFSDMEDPKNLIAFLRDLSTYLEILTNSNRIDVEVPVDTNPPLKNDINANTSSEIFEVEVNDGYVNNEFRPCADEEPWWEVVARLNGAPCFDSKTCNRSSIIEVVEESVYLPLNDNVSQLIKSNSVRETQDNSSNNNMEGVIANFWSDREKSYGRHQATGIHIVPIKKAYSFAGHSISSQSRKSTLISKTKSQSSVCSNMSQRTLREIHRRLIAQQIMAKASSSDQIPILNAVSATSALFDKENKLRHATSFSHVWRQSYAERTSSHEGYFDVDKYSLYASSCVQTYRHPLDCVAWESRSVKQRFLYEQSILFSRNWFGCLTATCGNLLIKEPICRPKSMEMPMEADEWTEEWFRRHNNDCHHDGDESDCDSWEDTPECGKIRNVRLRPGEKITRVTPDLTSYLRRSRWRKKHFPPGTFPYS
jgi:hypothetical protein